MALWLRRNTRVTDVRLHEHVDVWKARQSHINHPMVYLYRLCVWLDFLQQSTLQQRQWWAVHWSRWNLDSIWYFRPVCNLVIKFVSGELWRRSCPLIQLDLCEFWQNVNQQRNDISQFILRNPWVLWLQSRCNDRIQLPGAWPAHLPLWLADQSLVQNWFDNKLGFEVWGNVMFLVRLVQKLQ